MVVDARALADGTVLRAQVCVIGAGAAGITLARELSSRGLDVLLLESGGFQRDEATSALYEGVVEGADYPSLTQSRVRFFGGSTNHWAGFCRPLDRVDLERRPGIALSGWPFDLDSLQPYYERARPICGVSTLANDWRLFNERFETGEALIDDAAVRTRLTQISQRRHFGPQYRDDLVTEPRVEVCLWANAVRLALAKDGGHIVGVDCATLNGRRFRAEARHYVLATGGLEVPRLLLASNDVQPEGIGNGNDLVGRTFMEHLTLTGGALTLGRGADTLGLYYPPGPQIEEVIPERGPTAVRILAMLSLGRELIRREELLNTGIQVLPAEFLPLFDSSEMPGRVQALARWVDGTPTSVLGFVRLVGEQEPNPNSRVRLIGERDALGMRRIALDWQFTRRDRESLLRTMQYFALELGRRGLGRAQVAASGFVPDRLDEIGPLADRGALDFKLGMGSHHMGTARMHASPRQGVVNADCRVHGVANLYVAGSAVFPTGGSAPPTLTIVALALRLAEHLATRAARAQAVPGRWKNKSEA
jgi:choline dehydrogenase-like flavoprotein